jgi:AcrR family transcriptional regulator
MARKASQYHHGNLRQTLIDTALAMIEKSGLGSLSLREVARQAGVTHAAPYRHFRDRDALIVAIGIEGFEGLGRQMTAAVAGMTEPLERFRALGVAYARYAVTHPAHFKVMFSSDLHKIAETPELQAAGEPTLQSLVDVVAEAQAAGAFLPGDPRALALPAWSMIHGLSMLFVDGQLPALLEGDPAGVDSLANAVADVLLRGLATARPSRAKPRRRS